MPERSFSLSERGRVVYDNYRNENMPMQRGDKRSVQCEGRDDGFLSATHYLKWILRITDSTRSRSLNVSGTLILCTRDAPPIPVSVVELLTRAHTVAECNSVTVSDAAVKEPRFRNVQHDIAILLSASLWSSRTKARARARSGDEVTDREALSVRWVR